MVKVFLPEAMTRFRCNLKGCCCKTWNITFEIDDVLALAKKLPQHRRFVVLDGAFLERDRNDKVYGVDLARVGPERACHFLERDGRCELHAAHGQDILPTLCQTFPAHSYRREDGSIHLSWDTICPEVLEQIDESDGPYEIAALEVPEGHDLERRSRSPRGLPVMSVAGRAMSPAVLHKLERDILAALNDPARPALEHLARISVAIPLALELEDPDRLALPDVAPPEFDDFFEACVAAHGPGYLANELRSYEQFVFAISLAGVDWGPLAGHLVYDPAWREALDPHAPELQPLLRRFLAHRFFSAFERSPSSRDAVFNYGSVSHALGTAFRYTLGISRWLDRPPDRTLMKVGLGAAEYFFRALRLPPSAMPWFGMEDPIDRAVERFDVDLREPLDI